MRPHRLARSGRLALALGLAAALTACSTAKNTESTVSGAGPGEAAATVPLRDFSKHPTDEVVKGPEPITVAKAAQPAPATLAREIGNAYFPFDRWGLTPEDKKSLAEEAALLKQHPEAKLVIEGYCDERGSPEYNLVLGERRAQETKRYLTALGITNPVHVTSYGKERQVCAEQSESCYWKNRRAHLMIEAAP